MMSNRVNQILTINLTAYNQNASSPIIRDMENSFSSA